MKRVQLNKIIGGWSPVSFEMQDHPVFRELTEASLKVYIFCLRKSFRPHTDRYLVNFKFTYPEALNRLGLSNSTFLRAMKRLHSLGIIDYYSPGATRNKQMGAKRYQLSHRWKKWNTSDFENHDEGWFVSVRG